MDLAEEAGAQIALDLASFEIVRRFQPQLHAVLNSGKIACCFCNEVSSPLASGA